MKRIVIAGGSGFLGRGLTRFLREQGYAVVVLTRQAPPAAAEPGRVYWDGNGLGPWAGELEDATAIINLAGRSVNCRYHSQNRKRILDSRVNSTRVLGEAIARCRRPPRVWLNSSTATIYKHAVDRPMDEASGEIGATPEAKDAFSVEVAKAWERALDEARTPQTRKVALRTAMVLGAEPGSVFLVLCRLVRCGLGGRMGNGKPRLHSEMNGTRSSKLSRNIVSPEKLQMSYPRTELKPPMVRGEESLSVSNTLPTTPRRAME